MEDQVCLYCGEVIDSPGHLMRCVNVQTCDGRQGKVEASIPDAPDFDGETYERERDHDRLHAQLYRVKLVLLDGKWHTLAEIAARTGDPEASVSARIRDLRKAKFGGYEIEREYVSKGLWQYRMKILVEA